MYTLGFILTIFIIAAIFTFYKILHKFISQFDDNQQDNEWRKLWLPLTKLPIQPAKLMRFYIMVKLSNAYSVGSSVIT